MPPLATEWKLVNPTTWQFKLRPNVKFHNGDRLTSADVKFSYERSYDPNAKVITKSVLNTIERIETPDPLTVSHRHQEAGPAARRAHGLLRRADHAQGLLREGRGGRIQRQADRHRSGEVRVVGQGRPDRSWTRTRITGAGRSTSNQIIFRPLPELAARIAALLKGEVDIITKIPPDQMDRIAKAPTTKIEGVLYGGLYCLSVMSQKPPLDSKPFRQAMSPGHRPRDHRQGVVARAGRRSEQPRREGRQPPRSDACRRSSTIRTRPSSSSRRRTTRARSS